MNENEKTNEEKTMSETKPCCEESAGRGSEQKRGFWGRLFAKLDQRMKAKAEARAESGCCCSSEGKGKGGDCC